MLLPYLGWSFQVLIVSKSVYAALWLINYFSLCKHFPKDETLQAPHFLLAIYMEKVEFLNSTQLGHITRQTV